MINKTSRIWAMRLGLSTSSLFGDDDQEGFHSALLDGIAGSFTMSDYSLVGTPAAKSEGLEADWSWSSLMRHHVTVNSSDVAVTRSDGRTSDKFSKSSVENNLEDFFVFLEKAPPPQLPDAVDHTIRCFQKLRAEIPATSDRQLASFLALTALRLENLRVPAAEIADLVGQVDAVAADYKIDPSLIDARIRAPDLARRFFEELLSGDLGGHHLHLDLTVRHASGELFQAAHLAPEPPPLQGALFGLANVRVRPHSLKGIAYTPLGLARSLAEEAISHLDPAGPSPLTILDPACGSGTFLIEALAALSRRHWSGKVKVVGYDISGAAVASAQFALACAVREYKGMVIETTLELRDFLAPEAPALMPDVIVMNPPYMSWGDLSKQQRSQLREVLGSTYSGRPDLSMAFVDRAVRIARPEGIIATLLPVGVLAGEYAAKWRAKLAEIAHPTLIGALGDHSLFRFATVNIATVVLDKRLNSDTTTMLWSSEVPGAASASMRALRKQRELGVRAVPVSSDAPWTIYSASAVDLRRRPTWLPAPGLLGPALARFGVNSPETVSDLFNVRLGVRAGDREAFVLSKDEFEELPVGERKGFKPIAEKDDISEGQIIATRYLFVAGEDIREERELLRSYPVYADRFLLPVKDRLSNRSRVLKHHWWRLAEARNTWKNTKESRIVSRRWVRNDGYAVDPDGSFAVVQAYAWFPQPFLRKDILTNHRFGTLTDILRLYCIMFSSDIFYQIVREFSTNASGGQVDLQQKYLNRVPAPLLASKLSTDRELASMVDSFDPATFPHLSTRNVFAARCYGLNLNDL
jgi:hypothetical protein